MADHDPCGPPRRTLQSHHVPDQPPQLQYQPRTVFKTRQRRNRILGSFVIVLIAVIIIRLGPKIWIHTQVLYLQRQCTNFNFPARSTFDLASASPGLRVPPFDQMMQLKGLKPEPLLFLHSRQSKNGTTRLIAVSSSWPNAVPWLRCIVVEPSTFWRTLASQETITPIPVIATAAQANAGEIDRYDNSHFTIDVTVTDQTLGRSTTHKITYDGWLRDDDTVLLEARPPVPIPPPTSSPALSR